MKNILFGLMLSLLVVACNDDYLERLPETEIGKDNFFNTEEDLSIYINGLYNFTGQGLFYGDLATDNATTTGNTELKTIMTTAASSETINGGWTWGQLRRINFFLENFNKAKISDEALKHYEGLARFFRARFYIAKVKRFSDVPWYNKVISPDDTDALFKTQDSREFVVDKIMDDLAFATANVRENQPAGAVNKWVVKTYQARFALYEGTFRKYHSELGLEDSANRFLSAAADISKDIMDSGKFSLHSTGKPTSDYYDLFVNSDLTGNSEVIFTNIGVANLKNSGNSQTVFGNYEGSPARDLVQAYLMADGSFYSTQGDMETKQFVDEFNNRDPRLHQTYAFPGWELKRTGTYTQGGGIYIQQLQKNFSGYHQIKGFVNEVNQEIQQNHDVPLLRYAEVLLIYAEARAELNKLTQSDLDQTVNLLRSRVGMPEMQMAPAVDPWQLAHYPNIESATPQWKELLEIRRERRVELAFESLRMDDLMRWEAGKLLEKEPEGLYFPALGKYDLNGDDVDDIILISNSESIPEGKDKEVNSLGVKLIYYRVGLQGSDANAYLADGTSGTIQTVAERGVFESPKHYYRPIPKSHIIVNPNLKQKFGWD